MSTFKHGKWARSVSLVLAAASLPALSTAATLTIDGNPVGTYSSLTSTQVDAVTGDVTINTSGYTSSGTGGGTPPPPAPTYVIGGSVSGLSGGTLVLKNNGTDSKSITANGSFSFSTPTSNYSVSISSQPSGQTCTVANGSGTASADVTNVAVTCAATPAPTPTPANVTVVKGLLYPIGGSFFDLGPTEIKAFKYTPTGTFTYKTIATVQQSTNGATRSVWVSTTPGGASITDQRCNQTSISTSSYYGTGAPNIYSCQLQAGTQYYVNVQNSTSPNGATSTCKTTNCGFVITINGTGSGS